MIGAVRAAIRCLLLLSVGLAGWSSPVGAQSAAPNNQSGSAATPDETRPVVVKIVVRGSRRFTRSQLIAALGQAEGQPLDRQGVTAGLDVLWSSFHVNSRVSYRPVEGGVELLLEVEEIPSDFEPRFVGNSAIGTAELYEWAGLEPGDEVYLNRIPRIRRRLLETYLEEGFCFVEVDAHDSSSETELPGGASDVFFEIREGPRVKVEEVLFNGNLSFPNERFLFWRTGLAVLGEIEVGRRQLPFFTRPYFVRESLEADLVAMRMVYRDQGWLDAVVELDYLEFNEVRDRVQVHIAVDEGERYTVGSLSIEGVQRRINPADPTRILSEPAALLPTEDGQPADRELLDLCELVVGNPYEKRFVERDRFRLRRHYGERGYISHPTLPLLERFEFLPPGLVYDVENHLVHVTYRLAQGQRHFIREILFSQTDKTQDRVLRRELSIFPGDVADLKQIDDSLRRIRSIAAFRNTLSPYQAPADYRFNSTGDSLWKDLEYTLGESSVLRFDITAAAGSGVGVSAGVNLQLHNFDAKQMPSSWGPWTVIKEIARGEAFHGAGQILNLRLFPGTETSTYSLEFREPDLFRRHLDRYSLSLFAFRRFSRLDSHEEERRELGFRIGKQLTPDSGVFMGYSTGSVKVDELDVIGEPSLFNPLAVPELLAEQEGKIDLASIEFGYNWRSLDFPLAPNSGYTINYSTSLFDNSLGSDAEFVSSRFVFDWYIPMGEDVGSPRSRFRTRLELGVAHPFGDSDDVPYTERFFLGGRSLRGFDRRGVGPNENGDPIGGETMAAARLEYIFPLFSKVQPGTYKSTEKFTGAVFLDVGVLDPDSFSLDRDEIRSAAGFSISLWLGLPLTLSFGFPIDEGFEDDTRVFRFDIGIR